MKKLQNLSIASMKNVVDLFLELVQIDSPSGHEQDMITFIKKWLDKIGLSYQVDKTGNILAKNHGESQSILFCIHTDTVEPGRGIKPFIKNGFIKSSGNTILGADNKAAVASVITAVEEYLKKTKNPKSFEILFTVNEENGNGLQSFPFKWIKSKKGYIFDSIKPIGSIILKSPCICLFKAEFIGKANHSSTPEKGNNALIPAIKALNKINIGKLDKGETIINIGLINGGTGINIIPDKVIIKGEIRSYQKKLFDYHLNKIKIIFNKSKFSTDGFAPGYNHKKTSLLIKKVEKIYSSLSVKTQHLSYSVVSDANILNSHGIETINLGDGVENAHTTKEQIKIYDLIVLKKIIINLLKNYYVKTK